MKIQLIAALAVSGLLAGFSQRAEAYNYGYDQQVEVIQPRRRSLDNNYYFNCLSIATTTNGQNVYNHEINVNGQLDRDGRTTAGKPVYVSVNNNIFARFNLPQHSIWIKDGELISLSLKAKTAKGESLKFRYAGEGNEVQNRIELQKNRRTLGTTDISCTISLTPIEG